MIGKVLDDTGSSLNEPGAVIVETIFLWPGVGQLAVSSILSKDYPVVQGVVLLSALSYILINLLVDLSYTVLNPRIRIRGASSGG